MADLVNVLEEKVVAMEFAFMCLAKALHERQVLPLPVLIDHLQQGAEQLCQDPDPDGLAPVGAQLDALRAALSLHL